MHDELDILDNGTEVKYTGKRPVFLTVLCILTFVGAGLSAIYYLFAWVGLSAAERLVESFDQGIDNAGAQAVNAFHWLKLFMISGLVGSVLCVAGAIAMMFMRKFGYYIYIAGQVIPLVVMFLGLGTSIQNEFSLMWVVMMSIFPAGFVVMYGLNFKYLR